MPLINAVASIWRKSRTRTERSPRTTPKYKAFISYKHASAPHFAAQLESAIKRYAKPLLARPLMIFRDEKHLVPASDLPQLIADALDASEFLILLASPAAARSPWVFDELDRWCRVLGRKENMIVVLIDGRIEVDPETKSIDWERTDALPESLRDCFPKVPLYVDLRNLATTDTLTLEEPAFKSAVNGIVARLRDIDPNEMLGEEILQHRRNLRLRTAAVASLAILTTMSVSTAYVAFQQAGAAERERNSALGRESQLLAANSIESGRAGRHAEAVELALRALPDYVKNDPRPYRPEAEAALVRAVLGSPLRYHSPRPQEDLAAILLDETGSSVLTLSYSDALTFTPRAGGQRQRVAVDAVTSYQHEVDCRSIALSMLSCLRYHGGSLSGGCDKEIYPGHRQLKLLEACLVPEGNKITRTFLELGARADQETLDSYLEQFQAAAIVNTRVSVRLDSDEIKRRVAPNFPAGMVALHSIDRGAIDVVDLSKGKRRTLTKSDRGLVGMTWLPPRRLLVAFEDKMELLDLDSADHPVVAIAAHSIFERPIALTEHDAWIGITKRGQPIRFSTDGSRLFAEGAPVATVSGAMSLPDGSGFTWIATEPGRTTGKDRSSEETASAPVRPHVHNASDGIATSVDRTFADLVSISALDAERLAIVADGQIVFANRRSGKVIETMPLPLQNVIGAWLLSVGEFYRNPIPAFFAERPKEDPKFLLLANKGANNGSGGAYIFNTGSGELRQLDLQDAEVEEAIVSPTTIMLLADDRAAENGFTHALLVPRQSDPQATILRGPPEVGGVFDMAGTDSSGLHVALSENRKNVSVYSTVPPAPIEHCASLPADARAFFHIERISRGRLIGVAEKGLCFIDLEGKSRTLSTEFRIGEFLYAKRWQSVIAGHDNWGLHVIPEDTASPRELEGSTGDIDAIALSHDEQFLFAIIDAALRVWSLPKGELVFSSSPDWSGPSASVSGIAIAKLRALALGHCATFVVSNSLPLIAIGTLQDGDASSLRLIRYDTGDVHDIAFERGFDGLAFSPDGYRLAILEVATLRLIDGRSGAIVFETDGGDIEELERVEFDRGGKYLLAVPNRDMGQEHPNIARIWSLDGDHGSRPLVMEDGIKDARFSDDGETILIGDDEGHVALFDSGTGQRVSTLEQHQYIADVLIFPPGERLAVTADSIDAEARLFHRPSGIRLTQFEADFGSSSNNEFGRTEPLVAVPEWNVFLVATRLSGVVAVPFYFDPRDLRKAGEILAHRD